MGQNRVRNGDEFESGMGWATVWDEMELSGDGVRDVFGIRMGLSWTVLGEKWIWDGIGGEVQLRLGMGGHWRCVWDKEGFELGLSWSKVWRWGWRGVCTGDGLGLGMARPALLTRVGPVAQVWPTHSLCQRDNLHTYPIAHGPVGLLWMGTVSLHHLQLFTFCDEYMFVTPEAPLGQTSL